MKSIKRVAESEWQGTIAAGHGLLTTGSEVLKRERFSFGKRTEQGDREHTNPEEMIAAGLASCFSMALAKSIEEAGFEPHKIVVRAGIALDIGDDGPKIQVGTLEVAALAPGCSQQQLEDAVAATQKFCPVYLLLAAGLDRIDVTTTLQN